MKKDNTTTYSAFLGKQVFDMNTDDEFNQEISELLDMPFEDAVEHVVKIVESFPKVIRRMKMSSLIDIILNMDEEAIAELDGKEEEEPE